MPNQITCPHCHAHLKAQESIPPGKLIRCLKCRGRFSVRQPDPDTLISIPYHAPPRSPVFFAVLGLVALLVIGSGTALVMYCFSLPGDSPQLSQGKPADEDPDMPAEDEAENATDSGNANAPKPSEVKKHKKATNNAKQNKEGKQKTEGKSVAVVKKAAAKPKEPAWVRQAVAAGGKFLRHHVQAEGKWSAAPNPLGYAALTGLTLLECGVPAKDNLIQSARAEVLARAIPLVNTYELALAILFLDRLGMKQDEDMIRLLAMRLVAGQKNDGGWSYDCVLLPTPYHLQLLRFLNDNRLQLRELVRPEEFRTSIAKTSSQRAGNPGSKAERKPKTPEAAQVRVEQLSPELRGLPVVKQEKPPAGQPNGSAGRSDNSNTQFAILALWVAQHHGVPMERTFNLVDQRFRHSQAAEGSWSYTPDSSDTKPAMTCAGLLGLAVGHGSARQVALGENTSTAMADGDEPSLQDPAIQNGLKFLGQQLGKPMSPPNVYFLWSVERVAVLYHLDTIGAKDWYSWGAKLLLATQQEDGSWNAANTYPGANPTIDTCFALLFLKKANFVPGLSRELREYIRVRDPN